MKRRRYGGDLIGPAGGFVFYDKGNYSGGWRYLECAPEIAGEGTWEDAKQLCDEYSRGSYDDWWLPSIDELEALLDGNNQHDGNASMVFEKNEMAYWSSTEKDASSAWGIRFVKKETEKGSSVVQQDPATYSKSNEFQVYPVRQF